MGSVALVVWHRSKSPDAYAPSVSNSIAEPPTPTNSTPGSAQSALHSDASLRLFNVGSCSPVMSASERLIKFASTRAD